MGVVWCPCLCPCPFPSCGREGRISNVAGSMFLPVDLSSRKRVCLNMEPQGTARRNDKQPNVYLAPPPNLSAENDLTITGDPTKVEFMCKDFVNVRDPRPKNPV